MKSAHAKTPVTFPLSRYCRTLGLAQAAFGGAALVVALALVAWFVLLLLDENSIIAIPSTLQEKLVPVGLAALAALAACSLPLAVLYSAWTAAGRRDLLRAASTGLHSNRPSDRQMRWFLKDTHPWETAVRCLQVWAILGTLAGGVAAATIYVGSRPEEQPLGHAMLALAVVSAVITAACVPVIRRLMVLGAQYQKTREQRWPLPERSTLRQALSRDTTGNGDIGVVQ
ncbi:hypothetical protein [Microbacterium sp. zg-YB36]|uniref:hypothetical protein n=1 Tax=Microbacterium sp. zg-YB36 TaxID=2969407 RepID=UPI00214AA438|nr:hypothetical protein [Microbacterium sp. zg-YB36]MDL5352139.1 hypothetical protein [Microbacterium sp. zg-YB36]